MGVKIPASFEDSTGTIARLTGEIELLIPATPTEVLTADSPASTASFQAGGGGSVPITLTFNLDADGGSGPTTITGTGISSAGPEWATGAFSLWQGVDSDGNTWECDSGFSYGGSVYAGTVKIVTSEGTETWYPLYHGAVEGGIYVTGTINANPSGGECFAANNGGGATVALNGSGLTITDSVLDSTINIVTSQGAPPDPLGTFITPLVYDTTSVSGGCYAWDAINATYVKVSNVVA